jgi:hypothetical protein
MQREKDTKDLGEGWRPTCLKGQTLRVTPLWHIGASLKKEAQDYCPHS